MGFQQGIAAMNTMGRIGTQKLPTSKTSGINSNFFTLNEDKRLFSAKKPFRFSAL